MSLKVLHMSSEGSWRGGEQQIAYLIDELLTNHVQVFVAVKIGSEFEKYCIREGIPYYPMPFKNSLDFRTAVQLNTLCRKLAPDIIHMHSSKSHGIGVLSAILGNKTPLVLSRRVAFLPGKSFLTKWKYKHQSIKKIICVSDKVKQVMESYTHAPAKCITIHSGIDLTRTQDSPGGTKIRAEFNIPAEFTIIGNTSALESEKDHFTFIDSIALLVQRKIPLQALIIGRGSMKEKLQDYVTRNQLDRSILFTGFRNDIHSILPELDIFVITSREEGLGTSVLDAFAAGVPVVATAAGGIPEMVFHQQTGMLAPIGDSVSLANSIEKIIADENFRAQLIISAQEKVKEFSKEQTAIKTLNVYNEIAEQKKDSGQQ